MAQNSTPFNQLQNYSLFQQTPEDHYFISYKIPETTEKTTPSLSSTVEKVSPKKKNRGDLRRQAIVENHQASLIRKNLFDNNNNFQEDFSSWSWNPNSNSTSNKGTSVHLAKNIQQIAPPQADAIQDAVTNPPSSLFAVESPSRIFEIFSSAVSSSNQQAIQYCIQRAKEYSIHMYQLLNNSGENTLFSSSLKRMLEHFESTSHDKTEFAVTSHYEYAQQYTHAHFSLLHEKAPDIEYISKKQAGLPKSQLLDRVNKVFFIFLKQKSTLKECGSSKIVTDTIKVGLDGTVDTTYAQIRNLPGVTITKQEIDYIKNSPGVLHVFEYMSKHGLRQSIIQTKADGNLSLFEATEKKPLLTLAQIEHIFHQLAKQLFLLHSNGICHGDIKLENLLFRKENFECWITDFGAAFNTGKGELPVVRGVPCYGTVRYTAPEILCSPRDFNNMKARDMYALGIVLYELLIGEAPWMQHIVNHMHYCPKAETSEYLSEAMRQQASLLREYDWLLEKQAKGWAPTERERLQFIMMSLLHFDPNKRINASSLLALLNNQERPLAI